MRDTRLVLGGFMDKGLTYAVTARASRERLLAVARDIERHVATISADRPT